MSEANMSRSHLSQMCLFIPLRKKEKIPLFDYQKYCSFETFPILNDDENKMLRFRMVVLV